HCTASPPPSLSTLSLHDALPICPTVATACVGGGPHSFLLRSPRSLGSAAEKGITANLANGFVSVPRCVAKQREDDDEPDQACHHADSEEGKHHGTPRDHRMKVVPHHRHACSHCGQGVGALVEKHWNGKNT